MLTIHKASAGSGKTYNLALEYIKLLLGEKRQSGNYVLNIPKYTNHPTGSRLHSRILAITFTNKATAEMKSRIIRELDNLTVVPDRDSDDTDFGRKLPQMLGCTRAELAEAADKALRNLLNDYTAFNVSTIDSFFQTVLRSFAREIDRQGDFRLEMNSSYAIATAMSMLLDDINDGSEKPKRLVTEWMHMQAIERLATGADFNPFNRTSGLFKDITGILGNTFNEDFESQADKVHEFVNRPGAVEAFGKALDEACAKLKDDVVAACDKPVDALAAEGYTTANLNSSIAKLLAKVQSRNFEDIYHTLTKASAQYLTALRERNADLVKNGLYSKATPSVSVDNALFDWFAEITEVFGLIEIYQVLKKALPSLQALSFINDYINRFRQENNLILIADTNSLLHSIIDGSDAPFIYERVGVELHHFLIDEFQDTSRLQWENLRPLIDNSLATQNDSLIIGDVKQSIYRWRGGDSSLLDTRVESHDFATRSKVKGTRPGENTNYRSAADIVRFNNTLFSKLAARTGVPGYKGIEQSISDDNKDLPAYIAVHPLFDEPEACLRRLLPESEADAFIAAVTVDEEIDLELASVMLTGREIMAEHERGYNWKDIAVLCRTNDEAAFVADTFGRYYPAIPLVSDEALLVNRAPSVRMIVSILQLIDRAHAGDDSDIEAAEADSPRPAVKIDEAQRLINRFEYFMAHGDTIDDALAKALDPAAKAETENINSPAQDIAAIRSRRAANLSALVEAIIERKITPATREAELPYILTFCDAVAEFSESFVPTIHAFLEHWKAVSPTLAISAPDGLDAVTIMTIHKAKGLERDCVHIPIVNWQLKAGAKKGWLKLSGLPYISDELVPPIMYVTPTHPFMSPASPFRDQVENQILMDSADNLNVAYVAFTRPRRELHMYLHQDTSRFKKANEDTRLVDFMTKALNSAVPATSDLYLDTSAYITETGDFVLGSPTTPVVNDRKSKARDIIKPKPRQPGRFEVAFTDANSRATTLETITDRATASSLMDVDLGNEEAPAPYSPALDKYDEDSEAARRGNDMHAILSLMRTFDDLDVAARKATYDLTQSELDTYIDIITTAFERAGDYAERWFSPDARRVMCEQTIYDPVRDKNTRPDRLVWNADGSIDIVDYKFTTGTTLDDIAQVRGYIRQLRSMGYTNVRAFIWNLLHHKIEEIKDESLL